MVVEDDFSVVVIGLGYIGLPTAVVISHKGITVRGVDINSEAINSINSCIPHIVEPGLDMALKKVVESGTFFASTTPDRADVFIIAVPTPFLGEKSSGNNPSPDISFVLNAVKDIAPFLRPGNLIIIESTVPIGATEQAVEFLRELRPDLMSENERESIFFAYCPERVLPGHVLEELVSNDRVIGGYTPEAAQIARTFYERFVNGECRVTNCRTAEAVKLTENSFRDVNIAFANELSVICDDVGVSVWELIELANRHPRVNILQPGPGVGGHCIAVDPWFLVHASPSKSQVIQTSRRVNLDKPIWVVNKLRVLVDQAVTKFGKGSNAISVAFYGLAFKANIDDLRESPAVEIVEAFIQEFSGKVSIVEPNISKLPKSLSGATLERYGVASESADIHVLLVDHDQFKAVDAPASEFILDLRGIWVR